MTSNLGLVGDGDEIDLVEDVEAAFGVRFEDSELEQMLTVGRMYEALITRIGGLDRQANLCLSAIVFYKLRRALTPLMGGERLGPKSLIKSKLDAKRPDKIVPQLAEATGLKLPGLCLGGPQMIGCLVMISAFLMPVAVPALTSSPPWIGLLAILFVFWLGMMLVRLDYGQRLAHDYVDLGTLARRTVALNYGKLVEAHGYPGDADLWSALIAVLDDHTGFPEVNIERETRFIAA